jgi:L-alanine-DL-glutamate epimerase-like enolase superfamily enzyme
VPEPKNGLLDMPTAPGLGVKIDEAAFNKYKA